MLRADVLRIVFALVTTLTSMTAAAADACPTLLDRSIPGLLDGKPRSLCEYSGRVLLVVNTASRCGYTGQYAGLGKLQDSYGKRGLTVLGFPSNDFGNQEPGSDKDIAADADGNQHADAHGDRNLRRSQSLRADTDQYADRILYGPQLLRE